MKCVYNITRVDERRESYYSIDIDYMNTNYEISNDSTDASTHDRFTI